MTSFAAQQADARRPRHDGQPHPKRQRTEYRTAINGRHREIGLMRRNGEQDGSSFVGSSSGIYFVRSVYNALQNGSSNERTDSVPGEDDRLADTDRSDNIGIWSKAETSNVTSMTAEELRDLADDYFEHWHPTFPFLYAPSCLEAIEKVSMSTLSHMGSIDRHEMIILRAIMSISASDRRQCGKIRSMLVPSVLLFHSFTEAIESVQAFLSLPASLKSLQAVLAVQLFLISMLRHNGATRLGGLAVRLAFQLGLHRCPARYSAFSADEAQMRKRIFWTTYCLDRILCQSLGLPLGIRDDDIDVCSFDHEKHQDLSIPQAPLDTRLASLHFLTKHAQIKGMIVELCNKSVDQRPINANMCHAIEESMGRWNNEIDAFLELNPADTIFHKGRKAALKAIQFECVIALNRPLLALPKDSRDYAVALQTCINAARAIINGLHAKLIAHLAKVASKNDNKLLTPLFWPSFTWMVWMSAFIVLYAATHDELKTEAAKQLVRKSIEVLQHLSSRGTVWPDACAAAIRELTAKLDIPRQPGKGFSGHCLKEACDLSPGSNMAKLAPQDFSIQPQAYGVSAVTLANLTNGHSHVHNQQQAYTWPHELSSVGQDVGLFEGFDIPFWLGDDQYSGMVNGLQYSNGTSQ